jgi:TFIIF-interacting CTD phosphatase-like protein
MSKIFEVVIFTASIFNYAKPLVERIDKQKNGFQILSRRQCTLANNCYYKDLSRLGRDMRNVIMVDNSPQAFAWQPENGLPIISWFEDTRGKYSTPSLFDNSCLLHIFVNK